MYAPNLSRPRRPLGVAVLTVLQVISALGDIAIGALLLILAVIAGFFVGGPLVTLLFLLDFVVIGLGIFSFIMAYGLWTGKGWAWTLSLIGALIGIILGVVSMVVAYAEGMGLLASLTNIIPIVLYVIILAYLNTGSVRAFFGRMGGYAVMRPSIQPPVGQPYMPQVQPPSYPQQTGTQQPYYAPTQSAPFTCPNCGALNQPTAIFCDHCGTRLR